MIPAAITATATAPAKINLTLDVHGRRSDGFHELRSLIVGVDLCDSITCSKVGQADVRGVHLVCDDPSLATSDNLASFAVNLLAERCGISASIRVELKKRIPVAAGLGGGSSDAASTLMLCNELLGGGLGRAELATLGAEIGSDVPVFFSLPSAVVTGRGEVVAPITLAWTGWVLLVFVDVPVLTAAVYKSWRSSDVVALDCGRDDAVAAAKTAEEMSPMLSNGLEQAVFRVCPKMSDAYELLNGSAMAPGSWRISGAGSTLYRLFDDKDEAVRTARCIGELDTRLRTAVVAAPVGPATMTKHNEND